MALNPGSFIVQALEPSDTLLSVCCGIGLELYTVPDTVAVVGVDIVPGYIDEFQRRYPHAKTKVADALEYMKGLDDNGFCVVSCIDGLEHLTKSRGKKLLKEMKRVCSKKALIFTPQGYIRNEPKHAWGIPTGDEHQKHLSGWSKEELAKEGFELWDESESLSAHGEGFKEGMYIYNAV